VPVDVPLSATYFVVAHFHLVMGVSPILVVFGALYHWYPKMTGRMLNDTLGRIHFWITFIGTYMIYLPMYYLGNPWGPAPLLRVGQGHPVHPAVGSHHEQMDHRIRSVRRRRAIGVFVQPGLVVF